MKLRLLLPLGLFLIPAFAHGFAENVTHGYVNCLACHMAPGGGGVLNDYGRSLSKELMSTWGWANAEDPAFGAMKNKEWLKVGGDVRVIQTYLENSRVKQGRQFVMQQNIELAGKVGPSWLVGTFGTQEGPATVPRKNEFLSERHFLLWETSDETRVRLGKFRLNFGINDPNHTRVTKAPFGFGSNSETYNLEFSKFTETYEVFLSSALGRIDLPRDNASERSLTGTFSHYLGSKAKVGFSALVGESAAQRRHLASVHGIFPVVENSVVKVEVNFQEATAASTPARSSHLLAGYVSAGYTVAKGVLPYLFYEHFQPDLKTSSTRQGAPGLGLQWLPIPHVEIQAEYKRQVLQSAPRQPNDIGWLVLHLYI